jgi:transposase-like protein
MSRSTISTFKLFELFPTNESARLYLEDRLWPNGPVCPDCKGDRISKCKRVGFYHCNACNFDFTIRTGTIFERSKVPLHKWLYSMYLLVTARKGISSMQLAKEIGVTQKTAWFILGRLREACSAPESQDKLRGVIEIDECFVGGLEANKHESKKLRAGRGPVGKTAVLGMRERGGRTRAKVVEIRSIQAIQGEILEILNFSVDCGTAPLGLPISPTLAESRMARIFCSNWRPARCPLKTFRNPTCDWRKRNKMPFTCITN